MARPGVGKSVALIAPRLYSENGINRSPLWCRDGDTAVRGRADCSGPADAAFLHISTTRLRSFASRDLISAKRSQLLSCMKLSTRSGVAMLVSGRVS